MTAPEKEQYDLRYLSETIDRLEEATKNNWIVLYRSHYFRAETNESLDERILDGNAYYEMQDLLYTSDLLVTDFSSCIWDFALTGRPVFLLENRLKEYEQMDRGFFVPYDTWPYLKCKDIAALPDMAVKYRDEDFTTLYKQHFETMGSFEKGTACEQILHILEN